MSRGIYTPALEDALIMDRFSWGLTNLVERPTTSVRRGLAPKVSLLLTATMTEQSAELTTAECRAATPRLLAKLIRDRPRIVCFVGISIWEAVRPPSSSFGRFSCERADEEQFSDGLLARLPRSQHPSTPTKLKAKPKAKSKGKTAAQGRNKTEAEEPTTAVLTPPTTPAASTPTTGQQSSPASPTAKQVREAYALAPIVLVYPSNVKDENGAAVPPERTYLVVLPSTSGLVTQYQVRRYPVVSLLDRL